MAVITISREYGSSGSEVARKTADLLGYHLVDKAAIGRILAGYGLIDFEREFETEAGIWSAFDTRFRTIVTMLDRIAFSVARHGHSVILGRGSYVVLSGTPWILNVRIRAPFEWRVTRVMKDKGIDDRMRAAAEVREGDKIRSSFISSIYGLRWDSMEHFDLVMDASKIDAERAATWIAEAARDLPTGGGRAELDTKGSASDSTLDEAIDAELRCNRR
jgi:cytidylate kinase